MERGYLKLWRKSIESAVFADPDLWRLWCLCLMKATHKKKFVSMDGILEPVELLPGQFVTGRFALHGEFYPRKKKNQKTPYTVWRWLETLQKCENLSIKSYNKYSVITIENWCDYQGSEQQVSNRRATGEQQVSTNKHNKNKEHNKNTTRALRPEYIPQELWEDLINNRRFKKLQNTELALTTFCNSVKVALDKGFTVEQCIGEYVSSSWKRFNYEWLAKGGVSNGRDCGRCHYNQGSPCKNLNKDGFDTTKCNAYAEVV